VGKDTERQPSRGFAMKIMNISGKKLLDEEIEAPEAQD
jgi:hypothetical protein